MRRGALPAVSVIGKVALDRYEHALRSEEDLSAVTIRNYLSDLRQFAAWWERRSQEGQEEASPFTPTAVATPMLTAYRAYLQHTLRLKPASVNRSLVSLKRYFAWLTETGQIRHDPTKVVKLVEQEVPPPRHLSDQEEQALVAAVTEWGSLRDRTIIVSSCSIPAYVPGKSVRSHALRSGSPSGVAAFRSLASGTSIGRFR